MVVGMNSTTSEIPATAPYVVIDSRTGDVVYRTAYANRKRARSIADRKDTQYGAVRFITKLL